MTIAINHTLVSKGASSGTGIQASRYSKVNPGQRVGATISIKEGP